MAKDPKALLWVDLETTGTEERLDEILEVGIVLTDLQLNEIATFTSLVRLTEHGHRRLKENEFVLNMHTENGLLNALQGMATQLPNIREVDTLICSWLNNEGFESTEKQLMLAGSGVSHFDRRFIKHWLPQLEKKLQYPSLDIGVVRRFGTLTVGMDVPEFNEEKTHRGLDDIRVHLREAAWFVKTFRE